MEKINNSDFVRMVSKDTGYAQKDIFAVLESVSKLLLENLKDDKSTAVLKGMVVYPATYKDTVKFPRARFGRFFKDLPSLS